MFDNSYAVFVLVEVNEVVSVEICGRGFAVIEYMHFIRLAGFYPYFYMN